MISEALRQIRTMRQIKTSLEVARSHKTKTTNQLSRTMQEIESLESPGAAGNLRTARVLTKERARSAAYEASVEKSRQRLLKSREKLAAIIGQNRALTSLRHELQQARWQKKDLPAPVIPLTNRETSSHGQLRDVELKY